MLIMNKKRISSVLLASALILFFPAIAYSQSQPIVVLEYPNFGNNAQINSDNAYYNLNTESISFKSKDKRVKSVIYF